MDIAGDQLLSVNDLHEKYLFRKKLGKGGFSDVFLAEERKSGVLVAIKMMEIDVSGENKSRKAARFRREMMLYGKLDHPNIVKIFDSGETDTGILFIVFEYLKGHSLAELLLKEGAFSITRTMDLMRQVLNALGEAHGKGIIHRDLKPENIMVIADGNCERVKILDFGISAINQKHTDDSHRLTLTREFLGTPSNSAPEQLRGEAVSVKADIYAWGLLFLQCITGRSPFSGQTIPAVVQQQLDSSPVPLPAALINNQLGTLLRWTLEKNVLRRAGNVPVIISHLETISIETLPQQNGFLTVDFPAAGSISLPQSIIYDNISTSPERRQVTALCCAIDMKSMHPGVCGEILDELYQNLIESCKNLVKRYGAHIANDSGDRIFACFGYPDASDTDAVRAARCALKLANTLTQRNAVLSKQHGIQVTFRIGIHTGMITARKHSQNTPILFGLMLNYTGKLCSVAEQNTIIVSKNAYSLMKDKVGLQEISGGIITENFPNDQVYKLIGEKMNDNLLDIFTDNVSPMLGRDGELARLYDTWAATRNNMIGKIILLQGDAGIGKSRLASEFAKKISVEQGGWLECRCLPEGKNSALHPVLNFLRNELRLSETSSHKDNSHALEHHLKAFGIDCSIAMPIFGSWLGVQVEGYAMPQFSPQKQKNIILQLSGEILAKTAQDCGSVIMIEDLHWADPTTIDFLPKLFEQVKKRGIMLCMSARPAFVPSWNTSETEVISLWGLNDEHVEEVVRTIYGSEEIDRDTLSKIVSRVDGVPLFIEEITRLMREKKIEKEEIPDTLRDLLNGKIDQLGPARETAQLASVIGRKFDYNLIEKVSSKDTASLLADLDHLISAGIIHIQLVVGNPHYVFHHALVRDAAYESIDKKSLMNNHRNIAHVIENYHTDLDPDKAWILAYHWSASQTYAKALFWSLEAAQTFFQKTQFIESINISKNAIPFCSHLPEKQKQIEYELKLNQVLVHSLTATQGFASDEIRSINDRTVQIVSHLPEENNTLYFTHIWQLIMYYQSKADYSKINTICEKAWLLFNKPNSHNELAALSFSKGNMFYVQGKFSEAEQFLKNTVEQFDDLDGKFRLVYGFDLKVSAYSLLSLLYTIQNKLMDAEKSIQMALDISDSSSNIMSHALSLVYEAGMWHYRDDKGNALVASEKLIKLTEGKDIPAWNLIGKLVKAWTQNDIEPIQDTFSVWEKFGYGIVFSYWNFLAAQIEFENGMFQVSINRLEQFINYAINRDEVFYLSELYRLAGLCYYQINDYVKCMQCLINSLNHSRKINSKLFEIRTLNALDSFNKNTSFKFSEPIKKGLNNLNNDTVGSCSI